MSLTRKPPGPLVSNMPPSLLLLVHSKWPSSCQALASSTPRRVPGTLQDQDIRSKGTTWPSYLSGLFGTLLFKAAKVDGLLAKMSHSFLRGGVGRAAPLLVPLSSRPQAFSPTPGSKKQGQLIRDPSARSSQGLSLTSWGKTTSGVLAFEHTQSPPT